MDGPTPLEHLKDHITCDESCEVLETVLRGSVRAQILDEAQKSATFEQALGHLRTGMRSHIFRTTSGKLSLDQVARTLDRRTREDGFYVLHEWHHTGHRFTEENTPVLMLDFFAGKGVVPPDPRASLSILLDYYFLHLLALCAMRAWDGTEPNATLERVTRLVGDLQGPQGSGHQFVECAESLLIYAVSQFHPDHQAYLSLIPKIRHIDQVHQLHFARLSTAALAGHLRWGFAVMYKRDLARMREDNMADYPWLMIALQTLMRGYARTHDAGLTGPARDNVVEGILNGLTPDPWAFFDQPPASLSAYQTEHAEFRRLFEQYQESLMEDFARHRPGNETFSPLNFHFSFPHNGMVALVMVALLDGEASDQPLDALLTREVRGEAKTRSPSALAQRLMEYSRSVPEGLDTNGAVLVVHEPRAGLRHYNMTLATIRKTLATPPPLHASAEVAPPQPDPPTS